MKLYLSTAPHIRSGANTQVLMRDVLIALLPTTVAGIYYFGLSAAMVIAISIFSCVLFEYLWQRITKQPVRISDLSAAVTGLILGLNLPSTAPWWMPVIGALFAIVITKQLFGGIGDNFLNPALLARAVLLASWPARMTGATADRFLLRDRGYVREGYYADLTVFNEDALRTATPDRQVSFGIEKVFINGQPVLDGGQLDTQVLKTSGRAVPVR